MDLKNKFIFAGVLPVYLKRNSVVIYPNDVVHVENKKGKALQFSFPVPGSSGESYINLSIMNGVFYSSFNNMSLPFSSPAYYKLLSVANETCTNVSAPVIQTCGFVPSPALPQIEYTTNNSVYMELNATSFLFLDITTKSLSSATFNLQNFPVYYENQTYYLFASLNVSLYRNETQLYLSAQQENQTYYDSFEESHGRMSNTEYIAGEMDVEITSSEFQLSYLDSYLNDGATFIALNLVPIEAFDNFYTWTTFSQFEANLQSASIRYENSSVITYITFRNQKWFKSVEVGFDCPSCSKRNVFCPLCFKEYHQFVQDKSEPFSAWTPSLVGNNYIDHNIKLSLSVEGNTFNDSIPSNYSSAIWTSHSVFGHFSLHGFRNLIILSDIQNLSLLMSNKTILTTQSPNIGSGCNKIGATYQDFSQQANPCSSPYGTCLKNQISSLKLNSTNFYPFYLPELQGETNCGGSSCRRVRTNSFNNSLILQFPNSNTLSVYGIIQPSVIKLKEAFIQGSRQSWSISSYVPSCNSDLIPSSIQYLENFASIVIPLKNGGEVDGEFWVQLNCSKLLLNSSLEYGTIPAGGLANITFNSKISEDWNTTYSTSICNYTVGITPLKLWSSLGKLTSCSFNVTNYFGNFVPPCNLVRPVPVLSVTIINVTLSEQELITLNNAVNASVAKVSLSIFNSGVNSKVFITASCSNNLFYSTFSPTVWLSPNSQIDFDIYISLTKPALSKTGNCTFEVAYPHSHPNCTQITSVKNSSFVFDTSQNYIDVTQKYSRSTLSNLFGDYSDPVLALLLSLVILSILSVCAVVGGVFYWKVRKGRFILTQKDERLTRKTRHETEPEVLYESTEPQKIYSSDSIYAKVDVVPETQYINLSHFQKKPASNLANLNFVSSKYVNESNEVIQDYVEFNDQGKFVSLKEYFVICNNSYSSINDISPDYQVFGVISTNEADKKYISFRDIQDIVLDPEMCQLWIVSKCNAYRVDSVLLEYESFHYSTVDKLKFT